MTAPKSFLAALACVLILTAAGTATAQQSGNSTLILQYVEQDKVYLLEKLRPRVSRNSEKTVIDALLAEDGPKAARLFSRQLQNYPDPGLDSLSRARLAAYHAALSSGGGTKTPIQGPSFMLQFGSFGSPDNARKLADRVAAHLPVTIFRDGNLHKVRSKNSFTTREEASRKASQLPFKTIILQGN